MTEREACSAKNKKNSRQDKKTRTPEREKKKAPLGDQLSITPFILLTNRLLANTVMAPKRGAIERRPS